jgi:hypothetical protein
MDDHKLQAKANAKTQTQTKSQQIDIDELRRLYPLPKQANSRAWDELVTQIFSKLYVTCATELVIAIDLAHGMFHGVQRLIECIKTIEFILKMIGINHIAIICYSNYDGDKCNLLKTVNVYQPNWFKNIMDTDQWHDLPEQIKHDLNNYVTETNRSRSTFIEFATKIGISDYACDVWKFIMDTETEQSDYICVVEPFVGNIEEVVFYLRSIKECIFKKTAVNSSSSIKTVVHIVNEMYREQLASGKSVHLICMTDSNIINRKTHLKTNEYSQKNTINALGGNIFTVFETATKKGVRIGLLSSIVEIPLQWTPEISCAYGNIAIYTQNMLTNNKCFIMSFMQIISEFMGCNNHAMVQYGRIVSGTEPYHTLGNLNDMTVDEQKMFFKEFFSLVRKIPNLLIVNTVFTRMFLNCKSATEKSDAEIFEKWYGTIGSHITSAVDQMTNETYTVYKYVYDNNLSMKRMRCDKQLKCDNIYSYEDILNGSELCLLSQTEQSVISLTKALQSFKLIQPNQNANVIGDPVVEKFLPSIVLDTIDNMNMILMLLINFKRSFNEPNIFKVCLYMLTMKNEIIPELYSLAIKFVDHNIKKYLPWLFNSNECIEYQWQTIHMFMTLSKITDLFPDLFPKHISQNSIQRTINLLYLSSGICTHYRKQANWVKYSVTTQCYVKQCNGCYAYIPECLFMGRACVNCYRKYKVFKTEPVGIRQIKHYDNDISILTSSYSKVKCSNCHLFYSIHDISSALKPNWKPTCYRCRTNKHESGHVHTCIKCGECWLYCIKIQDSLNWTCATCYVDSKQQIRLPSKKIKYFNIKLNELLLECPKMLTFVSAKLGIDPNIIKSFASCVKVKPRDILQSDLSNHIQMTLTQQPIEIVSPHPDETYDEIRTWCMNILLEGNLDDYTIKINQPVSELFHYLSNIHLNNIFDVCGLGTCDDKPKPLSKLFNPCGQCSFMACNECINNLIKSYNAGHVIGVRRLLCFCGQPFCNNIIMKYSDSKILTIAQDAFKMGQVDDYRIGSCLNGSTCASFGGTRFQILPPYKAEVCDVNNPDDDIVDYRCKVCNDNHQRIETVTALVRIEAEKIALKHAEDEAQRVLEYKQNIIKSLRTGEIARKHKCGSYCVYVGASCPRVMCGNCKEHFCWICLESFQTSHECYVHISQKMREALLLVPDEHKNDGAWLRQNIPHYSACGYPTIYPDTFLENTDDNIIGL